MNIWLLTSLVVLGFSMQICICIYFYHFWVALSARYAFYGIRDELIQLVAEGVLSEDDRIFQAFYRWSNMLAKDARSLNLPILLTHLSSPAPDNPEVLQLLQVVDQANERVKIVVSRFFIELFIALIRSSLPLLLLRLIGQLIVKLVKHIPILSTNAQMIKDRFEDIPFGKQWENAHSWKTKGESLRGQAVN